MNPVVTCEHCGHMFEADAKLAGGYTNCPGCGKATPVEGLRDPLWRLFQVGAAVGVVIATAIAGVAVGPAAAVGVFVAGLALAWLISRAL
ncbi:MAG: hypothetical protein ABFS86_17385 [Planctomycetota bacterium]